MMSHTRSSLLFTLFLSLLSNVVYSQSSSTTATPLPTAAAGDPSAPPPPDPNDTTGWSVIIIDVQWTQLCIGMLPIIASVIVLASLYQFLWVPWWQAKMKIVEKEYNRLEKQRMGAGGRA